MIQECGKMREHYQRIRFLMCDAIDNAGVCIGCSTGNTQNGRSEKLVVIFFRIKSGCIEI